MQHAATSSYAPRRRSPAHSDEEGDGSVPSATASSSTSPSLSRPQRPNIGQTQGSFVRIKRKTTSVGHINTADAHGHLGTGSHTPISNYHQSNGERTVDQVVAKTCFICYEDDQEHETTSSAAASHVLSSKSPQSRNDRRWIHPCQCSLVAHEDCLMQWISSAKPNASALAPVTCPQCSTPYTVSQLNYPILSMVERLEAVWEQNIVKIMLVGVGAGTWAILSWHGVWAIRMFVGDQVAGQLLSRRWTRYLTAPLVLPVLVLSRTSLLDPILPFLPLTLVLNTIPTAPSFATIQPYPVSDLVISYPPNPALTLCLVPWVRAIYIAVRRRVIQAALGRRPTPTHTPASPPNVPANAVDGQHPPQAPVDLPGAADFAINGQNGIPEMADFTAHLGVEGRRVILTTSSSVKLLATSLLFPGMAATTGSLLFWLAQRQKGGNGFLGKLLGISMLRTAVPTTSWTTLGQISRPPIDPVWWRNVLGGALLVLLRDTWSITRRVMEMKRAASRRVENKPVREGLEI